MTERSLILTPALDRSERARALAEAQDEILELSGGTRSGGEGARAPAGQMDAYRLMRELKTEVAEYGAFPDVIPFTEKSFGEYGWPVPKGFDHLDTLFRFYWVRFPVVLRPAEKSPFTRLEYQIEFGAAIDDPRMKPKAHLIFPAKKFTELLNVNTNVELGVSGDVQGSGGIPTVNLSYVGVPVSAGASASGSARADVTVKIGPFDLAMRRAEIDHSAEGAQKVYWLLANTRLIREDNPSPVVVLQVPKDVAAVDVVAQLQAFHSPTFGLELSQIFAFLSSKVQGMLGKGAPIHEERRWANILP
jgi:hypothetical protein